MTTALHGGPRAIIPNPAFDKVTPLDIEPTFLFKALEVGDGLILDRRIGGVCLHGLDALEAGAL